MARITLRYEEGTLRVENGTGDGGADAGRERLPGVEPDPRSNTPRAPAYRYADLLEACRERGIEVDDRVLSTPDPDSDAGRLTSTYELRPYQAEALSAWGDAGRRGVLELPTGSGKTVIAVVAIERLTTATLVVVPTLDLLEQWRRELRREFGDPVGQLGGGTQRIEPLTVATYDSAYLRAEDLGERFGFVVFDEVHHLGGEGYREIARLLAAPARMGLTATFERPDGAHEVVADLVGNRIYRLDPDDLAGEYLAPYDVRRIEVELTEEERRRYERHQDTFSGYLARTNLRMDSGEDYRKLVMRSGNDPAAREALLARQRAREIVFNSRAKIDALERILDRHRGDRTIVFTAHNDLAYRVTERFLVPAITHRTGASERREILQRFRNGTYSRVVTSNVLDEGVDVPDANVAVVLSGSGSEREFTQRLGRILRPSDDRDRAVLYEVVSEQTSEQRVADRRRSE